MKARRTRFLSGFFSSASIIIFRLYADAAEANYDLSSCPVCFLTEYSYFSCLEMTALVICFMEGYTDGSMKQTEFIISITIID